jgi:hypothetical protein
MHKSVKRERLRNKKRYGPRGNPKFILLVTEERRKRDAKKIAKSKSSS